MFFAVLFEREKYWKTCICPPIGIRLHKLWNSHKMEQSVAILKLNVDILAYQSLDSKIIAKAVYSSFWSQKQALFPNYPGRQMWPCTEVKGRWTNMVCAFLFADWSQSAKNSHILPLCSFCLIQRNIGTLEAKHSSCKAARERAREEVHC